MTPDLRTAWPVYAKIGLLSFGGPAGQIALMQDEIVERRGWVSPPAFQQGLSVAMVLPGPEAQQLATWLGWRLHGLTGGLAAGLAFILPGAILMIGLAWIAAARGDVPLIAAIFYGIQPAVLVIVARAVVSLSRRALSRPSDWALAALAFLGIWAAGLPFPLIILLAALVGLALPDRSAITGDGPTQASKAGFATMLTPLVSLGLTLGVWLGARLTLGADPADGVAWLFTTAAFVSFGGAYALLPYVAERAVETYGWLTATQMLNGLAIAEATPGPLILVNTYAGFFAGWPGGASQGMATAALATVFTFAPSFMLILTLAPHVEAVISRRWIRAALAGVSAAVVGVVLNLAVYLGEAALLPSGLAAPEWVKIGLLGVFAAAVLWRPFAMHTLVIAGAVIGIALEVAGLI